MARVEPVECRAVAFLEAQHERLIALRVHAPSLRAPWRAEKARGIRFAAPGHPYP
jgi:hypothetical protein